MECDYRCGFRSPHDQQLGPELAPVPITKRGYRKRTWAMCFGSLEDTNAAWAEYEGLRAAVAAQGLRIERCKPKTKAAPAGERRRRARAHHNPTVEHTRELLRRLRRRNWCPRTAHLLSRMSEAFLSEALKTSCTTSRISSTVSYSCIARLTTHS
jgi:hypothetical protein